VPKRKVKRLRANKAADVNAALARGSDIEALVQPVLRESYLQATEDLRSYAEKVRYFNQCKKAIRDYLQKLRDYRVNVISAAHTRGVDLCSGNEKDLRVLAEVFKQFAHSYNGASSNMSCAYPIVYLSPE
jgi:hypothetical protein